MVGQSRQTQQRNAEGKRPRSPGPQTRAPLGRPELIRSLQRRMGNKAVGALLGAVPNQPPSNVVQRRPTVESMDNAWGEFTVAVNDANVFSFIVRLYRNQVLPDGGGGFTWSDFIKVIRSDRGKDWIKDKWRDTAGDVWGNQVIQGQHEWIKTDDVNYVILKVVGKYGGKDLEAWLAACESLRIPTADVAFNPTIRPDRIEDANQNPGNYSASTLGQFSGHVGAFYAPRTTPHEKDPNRYANRPLTTGEKAKFHTPLEKLLKDHLNDEKNDLQGFLNALKGFQTQKVWGGDIPNLTTASQIPNNLYGGQTSRAPLRGRYTSNYQEGVGVSTTFEPAQTVADLQNFAREAKQRNEQAMENRINAIVQQFQAQGVPQPLSNFRMLPTTEPAWTVDPTGKSVEDYDREAGYDAFALEPVAYGGDVQIGEDMEPDEEYSAAPINQPPAHGPIHMQPMPQSVVTQYGQARSALTHQVEQRFQAVTAEVQQLFTNTYQSEIKGLEGQATSALQQLGPDSPQTAQQRSAIVTAAHNERQAIGRKYDQEARRQFETYLAKKHAIDQNLYAQETRQTTTAGLQTLLETYLRDVDQLLTAYVTDIKSVLKI